MDARKTALVSLLMIFFCPAILADVWQISGTYDDAANPKDTYGALLTYTLEPASWQRVMQQHWFEGWELGLNISTAYWHTCSGAAQSNSKKDLYAFAIAPQVIWRITERPMYQPYADLSVGPAYLSTVKFAGQHLGSHLNFQDRVGIGLRVNDHWDLNIGYLHYSNASLASRNQGIDIHWLFSLGWRG